jgi:photosystem II stability/assembly factor-like uncharacterized protein
VLRTTDGGATWNDVTPPQIEGDRAGLSATFLDASHAWVAWPQTRRSGHGTNVFVFRTADGGQTWGVGGFTSPDAWGGQLDFIDSQHGWAISVIAAATGNDPVEVWRTTDGGATWSMMSRSDTSFFPGLPPGSPNALPPCFAELGFRDADTGFASSMCADGNKLLVTHDGGATWSLQPVTPKPPRLGGPFGPPEFVSGSDGFWVFTGPQGGSGTRVYATQDGGATWSSIHLPATPMTGLPSFVDEQHFVYYASDGQLFVTSDGGMTWDPFRPDTDLTGSSLEFVDLRHGWAVSRDPYEHPFLFATTDGGHTWKELPLRLGT